MAPRPRDGVVAIRASQRPVRLIRFAKIQRQKNVQSPTIVGFTELIYFVVEFELAFIEYTFGESMVGVFDFYRNRLFRSPGVLREDCPDHIAVRLMVLQCIGS